MKIVKLRDKQKQKYCLRRPDIEILAFVNICVRAFAFKIGFYNIKKVHPQNIQYKNSSTQKAPVNAGALLCC